MENTEINEKSEKKKLVRGICPVCDRIIAIKPNGYLWRHGENVLGANSSFYKFVRCKGISPKVF